MKKQIKNYNENYVVDWNTITNEPDLHEGERLKQLQKAVTVEQMKTCNCKFCFDSGASSYLFVDDKGETRQAYSLCTCEAIKNVVH